MVVALSTLFVLFSVIVAILTSHLRAKGKGKEGKRAKKGSKKFSDAREFGAYGASQGDQAEERGGLLETGESTIDPIALTRWPGWEM